MKRYAGKGAFVGLLLMAMALLASGCASDGASSYSQTQVGYGYYGAYGPGYYYDDDHHGDGTVTSPPPSAARPSLPPHVSTLPARPLPRPSPRPTPRRR